MDVCVIGTGYVGLVVGACLSDMGNKVTCVDNNTEKVNDLNAGIVPIYEPGLEEIISTNCREQRLNFSTDLDSAVKKSLICFIAVGTPQGEDGSADLRYVCQVAESIGKSLNGYKVIVDKSTVPVGTANKVQEIIRKFTKFDFDVVSNPEFLKQGSAVEDFLKPDRVVIGYDSKKAYGIMEELYAPFLRTGRPIIMMDIKSAEMTKYAANSFLAVKISFANEIANICEKVGADIEMVRIGMSSDSRIGSHFLFPGLGYGGSCFPKDVKALLKTGLENNCDTEILKAADKTNRLQRNLFLRKILNHFKQNLDGKLFAIWGLSFKPKTDDMREAPSVTIIRNLIKQGARIQAYDTKALKMAFFYFGDTITYSESAYDALKNADALLILTEWNEFRRPDFEIMKRTMKQPVIFDGRNLYDSKKLKNSDFIYYSVGRN